MDGTDAFLFDDIRDAIILSSGDIAVADGGSQEIRVFTKSGAVRWVRGGRGAGPDEFRSLRWLRELDGGGIGGFDESAFRLLIYGESGGFQRGEALDVAPSAGSSGSFGWVILRGSVKMVFDNGRFLVTSSEPRTFRQPLPAFDIFRIPVIYGLAYRSAIDTLHLSEGRQHYIASNGTAVQASGPLPLGAAEVVGVSDSFAVAGVNTSPVLKIMSQSGITDSMQIPLRQRPVSSEVRGEVLRLLAVGEDRNDAETVRALERSRWPPFFLPLYDELLIDDRGWVWVREFEVTAPVRTWVVLDRSGGARAKIEVADSIEILDVGTDGILGRIIDGLGVERIHLWSLVGVPEL